MLKYYIFLSLLPIAFPLYFHIGETERKCFIEEIPDETMVTGNYKVGIFIGNSWCEYRGVYFTEGRGGMLF